MEPVLIKDGIPQRKIYFDLWNAVIPRIQNIVDLYDALGFDNLTPAEFPRLFNDLPRLVFEKTTGGTLSIGGIPVNPAAAIQMIAKPEGYEALEAAIAQLDADAKADKFSASLDRKAQFYLPNITGYFVLEENNTVQLSPTLKTQLDRQFKWYATTEKQIGAVEVCKAAVAKFFELGLDTHFKGYINTNQGPNCIVNMIQLALHGVDIDTQQPIFKAELQNAWIPR